VTALFTPASVTPEASRSHVGSDGHGLARTCADEEPVQKIRARLCPSVTNLSVIIRDGTLSTRIRDPKAPLQHEITPPAD